MSFNTNTNNNNNNNTNNNVPTPTTCSNVILQTLKRRNTKVVVPLDERVTLEKAYGFTITSNSRLTQSYIDGTIAYLAGCVIVLYDKSKPEQQEFIISNARKTLTCITFSTDGKCLATGESGHEPKVRVWDVKDKLQICEFSGHKFSIECVCFTNSNLIVSIGSIHDMVVNVWNLKTKFKVASNKIACKIKGIAFARDSSFFVTVGNRHVKYWYLTVSSLMETVPLKGRAAILSDMRNMYFCDVVCGTGECLHSTYTITTNGILCEFNNEQRCINRSIELPLFEHRAYCIYADARENLFIGCSNGTILIYRQKTLDLITSLPRPHSLGIDLLGPPAVNTYDLKYPDCIALCFDNNEFILSSIYNDHSFYVWDIKDLNKVKKLDSHLFHSSCCWSLDTYSSVFNNSNSNSSINTNTSVLPIDTFITCSSDNTVRIWSNNSNNKYSKELIKIMYIDNDLSALCESDPFNEQQQSTDQQPTTQLNQQINTCPISSNVVTNESKMGARCLKISPYGKHLATGDRNGNIRITDLQTLESIALIEAHDGEVLYLQYSQPESQRYLLASSSRDRLIHIFDASRSTYDLLQTLDDHSAAITAVRFCSLPINDLTASDQKQLYIISCGADKSIMFRTLTEQQSLSSVGSSGIGSASSASSSSSSSPTSSFQFVRSSYVAEKQTFYDLHTDPSRNYIYTISQDRIIRTYGIKDGKKLKQFRGSLNEDGYLIKMDIDKTGQLLATSCTDKCVYIWDINTTECVAYLCGHSEVVYDLKFTHDNQHLITCSADGCILIWKLNNLLNTNNSIADLAWASSRKTSSTITSSSIQQQQQQQQQQSQTISTQLSLDDIFSDFSDNEQLPAWARNKLMATSTTTTTTSVSNEQQPKRSRPVWGPVSDTSFSFMIDNENQSIINSSAINSFLVDNEEEQIDEEEEEEEEQQSYDESIQTTIIQNNEEEEEDDEDEEETNKQENIISFPKPLDTSSTSNSSNSSNSSSSNTVAVASTTTTIATVRKSWICSNKEQDLLFNLLNSNNTPTNNKELESLESDTSLSLIKLDCDLENSFRRQSLSARYLMRNQSQTNTPEQSVINKSLDEAIMIKQQQQQQQQSPNLSATSSSSSSSASSSTHSSPSLKKTPQSPTTKVIETSKEFENIELIQIDNNKSTSIANAEQKILNLNQMTCDLVKLRKKSLTTSTTNKMHSHHTESSLNKAKPKQQQQQQQQQQQLKRSPSVNSINNENDSSASSSTSSIKHLNTKTKMISKQISTTISTSQNVIDDSNLKKASSMVSLLGTKQQINNNNKQQLVIKPTNLLLPPRQTVRQIKQRSAERQQLITILPITTTNTNTNLKSNITVAATFNEQNKHLRKLSNSIQNLHNVNETTTTTTTTVKPNGVVTAAVNAFNKMNHNTTSISSPIKLKPTTLALISSSSSSSSSCSLFDNVSSISSTSSTTTNELNTVIESSPSSSTIKPKTIGCFTPTTTTTSNIDNIGIVAASTDSGLKSHSRFTNDIPSTSTIFKKQITFASIAAAANSGINNNPITTTTTTTTSPLCSPKTTSKFTSYSSNTSPLLTKNKIETIIEEFNKNIYILQLVSNQTNKITDDLNKVSNTNGNSNLQLQTTTQASQQTLQLMQTFNTNVQSIITKFNSSLNAIKVSQQINNNNTNSDNNIEIS